MSAQNSNTRFSSFVLGTFQNLFQNRKGKRIFRKSHNIQSKQRLCPHGINIAQCIGGSNGTKIIRIVHNGCEEIECLHNGCFIIDFIYCGIIGSFRTHQHFRVKQRFEFSQNTFQMLWLDFTCTTQTMCVMRQFYILIFGHLLPALTFFFWHQGFYRPDDFISSFFHFIHSQATSGGKANGSHSKIQRYQHGFKHRRHIDTFRMTGSSSRGRNAFEPVDEGIGLHARKRYTQRIRQPLFRMSVQLNPRQSFQQQFIKIIAGCPVMFCIFLKMESCNFTSFSQPHNLQYIFSSGAQILLMVSTMDKFLKVYAIADVQSSDTFGCIEFMPGDAQQIHTHPGNIYRDFSQRLCGIRMHENTMFFGNGSNFGNGLDASYLIVGMHHRNQDGFRTNGLFQFIQLNNPKLIYRNDAHCKTIFFKITGNFKYSRMFHRRNHNVISFFPVGKSNTLNGIIV